MVWLTGEIARVAHCSVVSPLGTSQLESEPDPRSKVSGAHVPNGPHLVRAGEEDLGALVQLHAPFQAPGAGGAAPAAAQGGFRSGGGKSQGPVSRGATRATRPIPAPLNPPTPPPPPPACNSLVKQTKRSVFTPALFLFQTAMLGYTLVQHLKRLFSLGYFNSTLIWIEDFTSNF